jgi:hypothetical protein
MLKKPMIMLNQAFTILTVFTLKEMAHDSMHWNLCPHKYNFYFRGMHKNFGNLCVQHKLMVKEL